MPIHDLGYRAWEGRSTSLIWRWWVIAEVGIGLAWKNMWLRRITLLAWTPALYFGLLFFAYEGWVTLLAGGHGRQSGFTSIMERFVTLPEGLLAEIIRNPTESRLEAWSYLFFLFFSKPMTIITVLVVGLIAPPLIAQDMRSRAFILYFSRPIARLEYMLGKASIIWTYGALTALAPALVLYVVAVVLSPSYEVVTDTWTLPFRTLGAGLLLLVPTTALALVFSSLTLESRYASFAWFAMWILGAVAFTAYRNSVLIPLSTDDVLITQDVPWLLASLYNTLGIVLRWIFGMETDFTTVLPALSVVVTITVVSVAVLYRRISAPMRV